MSYADAGVDIRLVHEQTTAPIAQAGGLSLRPMQPAEVDMLVEWFTDREIWSRWWGHEDGPYEPDEIDGGSISGITNRTDS